MTRYLGRITPCPYILTFPLPRHPVSLGFGLDRSVHDRGPRCRWLLCAVTFRTETRSALPGHFDNHRFSCVRLLVRPRSYILLKERTDILAPYSSVRTSKLTCPSDLESRQYLGYCPSCCGVWCDSCDSSRVRTSLGM